MRDYNDCARRMTMFFELAQHMDARSNEFADLRSDAERMNRVVADLGEVAHASDAGIANVAEMLHLPSVPLLLWLEQAKREAAW